MSDVLIVGSGPVGCVSAWELAQKGYKVFLIDKRNHIAGNCFDTYSKNKVLYHKYGPHYFRTNSTKLYNYLLRFSDFYETEYVVKAHVNKTLFDIPINLNTINKYFNIELREDEVQNFLKNISIKIKNPSNFQDFLLSKIGKDLYKDFFENYTKKQWGIHPHKLPLSTAKRLPIRSNKNENYVDEKYLIMPKNGFTSMFDNFLKHKNITTELNIDYFKNIKKFNPKYFTLYTGPIDQFFNYKYGKLNWRSLKFKFQEYNKKFMQDYVQINYPNNFKFTRKVEIKHVTKQKSNFTVISKEYPIGKGDPYYPMSTILDKEIYRKYKKEADKLKNFFFVGRLAEYTYINTDQAIEKALYFANKIPKK